MPGGAPPSPGVLYNVILSNLKMPFHMYVLYCTHNIYIYAFNTLRAGLIQAVRKKQLFRTWLCG